MKKSISFLLLLAVVTAASAQVRFGVKGGLNLTHISFEESEIYDIEKGAGFFIGPMVKLSLPIGLGFDVAVLYDQRNAKQRSVGLMGGRAYQTTIKQHQIAVPVNVRYGFGLAKVAELYVFAGPQISFNVGNVMLVRPYVNHFLRLLLRNYYRGDAPAMDEKTHI